MIVETLETRWFWKTAQPDIAARLFNPTTAGFDAEAASRTDKYFLLPGCPTTGIKLREGCFEIKALVDELDESFVDQNISGSIQKWVKWSVPTSESMQFLKEPEEKPFWYEVRKSRFLRYFEWTNGKLIEVPDNQAEAPAGHVELTRASVTDSDETWLTLGMEVSSTQQESMKILKLLIKQFFQQKQDVLKVMHHAESLSYPQWLHRIFNRGSQFP